VDSEQCRLLSGGLTERGTPQVKEHEALANTLPRTERGRPMALGGMTGHSYAEPHRHDQERQRRFAREVAEWLSRQARRRAIQRLVVFAPSKLLGELRRMRIGTSACQVQTREGALTHLEPDQLAEEARVRRLLAPPRGS
jgi:protein required for attachment to host cells